MVIGSKKKAGFFFFEYSARHILHCDELNWCKRARSSLYSPKTSSENINFSWFDCEYNVQIRVEHHDEGRKILHSPFQLSVTIASDSDLVLLQRIAPRLWTLGPGFVIKFICIRSDKENIHKETDLNLIIHRAYMVFDQVYNTRFLTNFTLRIRNSVLSKCFLLFPSFLFLFFSLETLIVVFFILIITACSCNNEIVCGQVFSK